VETTRIALQSGAIPAEWKAPWERMIREFVRDDVTVQWTKNISIAGDIIAKKVNRPERKQFDFDSTMTSVKSWVDNSGGRLIADLTTAQMDSTHALLQHQIAMQVTSPYVLSQRIKPLVGLTNRETMAVAKFMATLQEQGVPPAMINKQVANYSKFLHKNRAQRIARTEISDAFNFGQLDAMNQAVREGHLPGVPEKSWMAGGADPCDICLENESVGPIALPDAFPSGDEHPTAHPQCECAVSYKVRRGVGAGMGERPTRIVPRKPKAVKPKWKPSGTEAQVTAWAKGSAIKETLWHGTLAENVAKIKSGGFKFDLIGKHTGNEGFWGKGFYFTPKEGLASSYAGGAREGMMKIKLNVRKPATGQRMMNYGTKAKNQMVAEGLSEDFTEVIRRATKMAKAEGYDSVIAGNEIVVFDYKNIMVIE
ncbi:MAG: hypothetical protein KAV87_65460, partial [Desulfobacteraceae bacterium]|nr:hypothetical protein [Desulfobacteraceae bacterium]